MLSVINASSPKIRQPWMLLYTGRNFLHNSPIYPKFVFRKASLKSRPIVCHTTHWDPLNIIFWQSTNISRQTRIILSKICIFVFNSDLKTHTTKPLAQSNQFSPILPFLDTQFSCEKQHGFRPSASLRQGGPGERGPPAINLTCSVDIINGQRRRHCHFLTKHNANCILKPHH